MLAVETGGLIEKMRTRTPGAIVMTVITHVSNAMQKRISSEKDQEFCGNNAAFDAFSRRRRSQMEELPSSRLLGIYSQAE